MLKRTFNGSPTVDGYYTTFDSSEVHRIESTDEGGGGSSDFSMATLSIVDEGGFSVNLNFATLNERRGFSLGVYPGWNATGDLPVILYKGTAVLGLENLDSANISITGAIEDVGGNTYAITGDCTINVTK